MPWSVLEFLCRKMGTVSSTDVLIFDSCNVIYHLFSRIPCYNLKRTQKLVLEVDRDMVISYACMVLLVAMRRSSGDL